MFTKKIFMKQYILTLVFGAISLGFVQAQENETRYLGIQGIGYLHTQTALILNNWEHHPLNHEPMGEQEAMIQKHFLEEFEHDEEWVDIVLVESNLFDEFNEHLDDDAVDAIKDNLAFYRLVLEALKTPEKITKNQAAWQKDLIKANIRLYDIIYPALCK